MYFFDYFFYRVSNIVQKSKMEEKHPEASGGAIISLFQMFNIVTILYFVFSIKATIELYIYIGIPLFIIGWMFFFNGRKLQKYKEKWDNENKKSKQIKGIIIIAYMLLSIFFFVFALSKM